MVAKRLIEGVRRRVREHRERRDVFRMEFDEAREKEARNVREERLATARRRGREAGRKAARGRGRVRVNLKSLETAGRSGQQLARQAGSAAEAVFGPLQRGTIGFAEQVGRSEAMAPRKRKGKGKKAKKRTRRTARRRNETSDFFGMGF